MFFSGYLYFNYLCSFMSYEKKFICIDSKKIMSDIFLHQKICRTDSRICRTDSGKGIGHIPEFVGHIPETV